MWSSTPPAPASAGAGRRALWATLLQIVDGFVLLLVLPREVLLGLMRGGAATMVPLTLSILFGLGLLMMLSRASNPVEKPALVTGTLSGMMLVIAIMSITRHQVRALYLEAVRSGFELASAPQWGNFVLFAVLLVAGLVFLAYMVRRVLGSSATGEQAA